MGSFNLYGANFPAGTYAWTIRYYDPDAGQWLNRGNWLPAVTVDQPISLSNVGLNGAWIYTFCQGSTEGGPQFGAFGPYTLSDGQNYQIDVRTGQMTQISGPQLFPRCVIAGTPGFPAQAKPGDRVSISCFIKNEGNDWGDCTVLDDLYSLGISESRDNSWLGLDPGQTGTITISFTMLNGPVTFHLWAAHWNFDTSVWVNDGEIGPFTISPTAVESQFQWVGQTYS